MIGRRAVLAGGIAALAAPPVVGQAPLRVLVIGGGAGGAAFARTLALNATGGAEIVLLEPGRLYQPAFLSNLALTGIDDRALRGAGYGPLSALGITVIHDWALPVDLATTEVRLAAGGALGWDRLVLAAGVEFDAASVPGWEPSYQGVMPHAWRGGAQVRLLADQIAAMRQGGTFCMIAPPMGSRGDLAVLERVTLVAQGLAQTNPGAKVLLIDPVAERPLADGYAERWQALPEGMLERVHTTDFAVRPEAMEVRLGEEVIPVDVCNVVPAQRAGPVVAALADGAGRVPASPWTLQAEADPRVFVLGDLAATGAPRSAQIALTQAEAAASVLLEEIAGSFTHPPDYTDRAWPALGSGAAAEWVARHDLAPEGLSAPETGQNLTDPAANWAAGLDAHDGMLARMLGPR
ncbi:FAD-dependent oxidoreductase [Halodurantibacterium flavum]|uniref:FAD-dependent oxidoreductase n=1 Tax=Halodurantibacterium flavum TaxID=1382802 RepID=A0ABW4S672_9RHOB